jgi:acetylglutamate kinase
VIKIGGSTLGAYDTTLEDLVTLQRRGTLPVVVHGGGKVISEWMERQGLKPRFYRGSRVTDPESLEVVTAVLAGVLNKQLVASIFSLGGRAVGLSGADGGILEAKLAQPELGLVGRVVRVNPEPILKALEAGYIPVVATVGIHCLDGSPYSGGLLNINADYAAGEIAHALRAQRLIYLTDVEGVMGSSGRLLARLTPREAGMLLQSGVASGGMIPKLEACIRALERVPVAEIIDGRKPGALLDCLSGKAMGTRILGRPSPE